jgi:hypothetical protein
VRDLFKHISGGQYDHWEPNTRKWFRDNGRDRLLHVISDVLQRRLEGGDKLRAAYAPPGREKKPKPGKPAPKKPAA